MSAMSMRLYLAIFVSLCFLASSGRGDEPGKLPERKDFQIFLLIGQSNMAGRGKPLEEEDKTPHPRVHLFTKEQTWVPAVDPLHFDKPNAVGVGLGLTFAKTVAESQEAQDKSIGLVPAAFGGSSIGQWARGAKHYVHAVERAKAAQKAGTLAGILWHQGESDSDSAKAALYEEKLDELIQNLRTDLDAPSVPFIVGTLSDSAKGEGASAINAALLTLSDRVPHAGCALAKDLSMSGDKIHFSAASYRELGRRYAAEWLRVAKEREPK